MKHRSTLLHAASSFLHVGAPVVTSLLVALVAACSSSSPSDGNAPAADNPGTTADLDAALKARASAYCGRVFECCEAASSSELLQVFAGGKITADTCQAGVTEWLKTQYTAAATSLQRKDLDFYPARESACAKEEAAKTCTDTFALGRATSPVVACAKAFVGKVKDGASCTTSSACASGFCKLVGEAGTCAPVPAEGDTCDAATDCGIGALYCSRANKPPACAFGQGVCRAREGKADGEACCNPEECAGQTCLPNKKGQPICNATKILKCSK